MICFGIKSVAERNKVNDMNDKIVVSKKGFIHGKKIFVLDDLFSSEYYDWANKQVREFDSGHAFDNITFLMVFQRTLAVKYYLINKKISSIEILPDAQYDNACYAFDAATQLGIEIKALYLKRRKYTLLKANATIYAEFLYLLAQQIATKTEKRELEYDKDLCVIRTPAAKAKLRNIDNLERFYEDGIAKGSMYSFFEKKVRISKLFQALKRAGKLLQNYEAYLEIHKCIMTKSIAYNFTSTRILPVCFYETILDELQKLPWKGRFVSGNNLDMYAYVEEQVSHNNKMSTICIPHGLEYGFKLPHCFTGDVFYTTSNYAVKYLNDLYETRKFVFDKQIAEKMFSYNVTTKDSKEKTVVYFSEPREPEVNIDILCKLKNILGKKRIDVYIKHHPKDKKEDYSIIQNLQEIESLQEAVTGNLCIARKSTTLLEGIYNGSKCASILINEKDKAIFQTIPSLSSDSISCFYNIDDLADWVEKEVTK